MLCYFGWAHVYWFFDHFGIDSSVLGPSTQDCVMRSVDALFIPLIAVAIMELALIWGYIALPERARRRSHRPVAADRADCLSQSHCCSTD